MKLLRALRPQGIHPVPGVSRRHHQELLPATTTSASPTTSSCREAASKLDLITKDIDDWKITFVDTGLNSNIGQRLVKVRKYVETTRCSWRTTPTGSPTCRCRYARSTSFRNSGKIAMLPGRQAHGQLSRDLDEAATASSPTCKSTALSPARINGGFFICKQQHLRLHAGGRGTGGAAVPAADRAAPAASPTHMTASGPAWTRSRRSSTSTSCSPGARRPGKSGRTALRRGKLPAC